MAAGLNDLKYKTSASLMILVASSVSRQPFILDIDRPPLVRSLGIGEITQQLTNRRIRRSTAC